MNYRDFYNEWYNQGTDEEKRELDAIRDDEGEIRRRFGKFIDFGTGGLRGFMECGLDSMNEKTVALATQAICDLIKQCGRANDGIVVGHDSRNNSRLFAEITASVAAANGIKAYIFDDLRPTPELSFAIRELGCCAGVNITASHNPKEYNGYKAYWDDGAQLPPEHADVVASRMKEIDIFTGCSVADYAKAVEEGKITVIGKEMDGKYLSAVLGEAVYPEAVKASADELKIVYTPLHGAGRILVPEVFRRMGLKHIYTVDAQMVPDGNFPTVEKPNPEYRASFTLGIELANAVGSDLIVATDPDADRVGVMIRNSEGEFINITGNQMGAMLIEYLLSAYEETGTVPPNPYAVKTIVTTPLAARICEAHGVKMFNVLTGFKFIGEVIKEEEASGRDSTFVFGFEESYGYLKGTYARDKDSVVASMLIAEMTAFYRQKGMTLFDALNALYAKHGYFLEKTMDIVMSGSDAQEKMVALMKNLRANPPKALASVPVVSLSDYQAETTTVLATGETSPTGLPKSNVLYFTLEGGDVVVVRPSGTEPKVKVYYLVSASTLPKAEAKINDYKAAVDALIPPAVG